MKQKIYIAIFILFHFSCYSRSIYDSLNDQLKITIKAKDSMSLIKELIYIEQSNKKKLELIELLKRMAVDNKNNFYLNVCFLFKSKLNNKNGDIKNALIYAHTALKNSIKDQNNNQIVQSYLQIGSVYYNFMKDDSAEYYYNKGINFILKNKIKDENEVLSSLYGNLGLIYKYKNMLDLSIKYFIKSYETAEKVQNWDGMSSALLSIGDIYIELKDFQKSEKYLLQVLKKSKEISINDNLLSLYRSLGLLYSHWGKFNKAKYYNTLALNGFKKSAENLYIWDEYNNLSIIFTDNRRYEEAHMYNKEAILYAKKLNNLYYTNISKINLARIFIKTNEFSKAEGLIKTFINDTCCKEKIDLKNKGLLYNLLYELYQYKKDYKNSLSFYKKYKIIEDSFSNTIYMSKTHEIETRYQTEKKEAEILRLNNENLTTQVKLNNESRWKWIFGIILVMSLIGLGVFWKLYSKIKKQKEYIENLQKELHHRIKNNLSIINKFIEDIKTKGNPEYIEANLTELQNKIESINTVHKQLYESHGIGNLNLKEYVNSLSENISKSFNLAIDYKIEIDQNLDVPIEKSFPLGLIINEFITNSYKYAFGTTSQPSISVQAKKNKDNKICIELSDNGVGFNVDTVSKNTLGLRLIQLLGRQMDADCVFNNQGETKLTLNF
jgi:two-component sensor histidine kinase/tetratricopeptide (TPR) repeat protein